MSPTSCGGWQPTPTTRPVRAGGPSWCATRRGEKAIVRGDAALVASAIENVVRNGLPLAHAGRHVGVDISIASTATHAHIVVRDHGPGVPPGEIDRIFLSRSIASALRAIAAPGEQDWACRSPLARPPCTAARNAAGPMANGGGLEVAIDLPLYKALHPLAVS